MAEVKRAAEYLRVMSDFGRAPGVVGLSPRDSDAIDSVLSASEKARADRLEAYLLRSSVCGSPGGWWLSAPIVNAFNNVGVPPYPADMVAAIVLGEERAQQEPER